ncbi:pleckstrin homology domain-containing family F member 1-like [Spinachia spinachia]
MDLFKNLNRARIQAVEQSFGPAGASLSKPGRLLMGQGRLMKQGRDKPQPKVFFLFNDVLVYGSIILNGRWYKNQKVIPLEGLKLEDMEDSETFRNQWLMRSPRKSFFVSAPSYGEKRAWLEHIEECCSNLQQGGAPSVSDFAVTWIPDRAADKCMRCFHKFSATRRRHHCRKCGFLVCNACSTQRAVLRHIHPTKPLRVCRLCNAREKEDEVGKTRTEAADEASSSDEGEGGGDAEQHSGRLVSLTMDTMFLDANESAATMKMEHAKARWPSPGVA